MLDLKVIFDVALSNPQGQGDPIVAGADFVFDIVPQIPHISGRGIRALRRHLMRNCKSSVIGCDVAVTARAVITVEVALLDLAWMEIGRLELPDASVTLLALVEVERDATVLIAVL